MADIAMHGADETTLRLIYPQWQGAYSQTVAELLPEVAFPDARRAYAMGTRILEAILPPHDGPTETVAPSSADDWMENEDGIESRRAMVASISAAQDAMTRHRWDRLLILGGDCAVSVAPFSALAARYGNDLAVVWLDSHPDVGTPGGEYPGFHAMALATLTGHGDRGLVGALPSSIDPARVAVAGVHVLNDDERAKIAAWGITAIAPEELRTGAERLTSWLASTGCTRVAIHFDVDAIDSAEYGLGLGRVPGGLSAAEARQVVVALSEVAEVVGLTIAEFIPRDALAITTMLRGLPLVGR